MIDRPSIDRSIGITRIARATGSRSSTPCRRDLGRPARRHDRAADHPVLPKRLTRSNRGQYGFG
jgi:hypothetical protein